MAQAPQEFSLKQSEGPTQGMKRVGCNIYWVNWLLAENKIPFNQLRSLPVGKVFTMRTFDCTTEPGPQERQASELVMWDDTVNFRALQIKRENELLKVDLAMQRTIYSELETERNALVDALNQAQTDIKKLTSSSATASTQETWSLSGWKLGALCFALVIVGVFALIETIRAEQLDRDNGILRFNLREVQKKSNEHIAALARGHILLQEECGVTQSARMQAAFWQEKHQALKARQSHNLMLIKDAWRRLQSTIRENDAIINDLYEQLSKKEESLGRAESALHLAKTQLTTEQELRRAAEVMSAQLRAGFQPNTHPPASLVEIPLEEDANFILARELMRANRSLKNAAGIIAFLRECHADSKEDARKLADYIHTVLNHPEIKAILAAGISAARPKNNNGESQQPRFAQPAQPVHAH